MQRLITLFATFNRGGGPDNRFDVVFDLEEARFYHYRQRDQPKVTRLKLSRVFSPRDFINDQAELAKLPDADKLLNDAVDLHSRFQEYALPVVTIVRATTDEAVKIFMNINRGGSDLSSIDFMRALTWHNNFDLNHAVEKIKSDLPSTFQPDDETVAKIVALCVNVDPIPDSILKLQEVAVATLERGIVDATKALTAVAQFLRHYLGVASADFVPYEGQMLVLASVFKSTIPDRPISRELAKWFIASSFSEAFQGRPDHFIIRLVRETVAAIDSGVVNLDQTLDLDAISLSRKRLTKGTAISSAFLILFSLNKARSIFSDEIIAASEYLESFDSSKFGSAVSPSTNSRRRLMDVVLLSSSEAYLGISPERILEALWDASDDLLSSQLLDRECVELLTANNFEGFVAVRASLVISKLLEYLGK